MALSRAPRALYCTDTWPPQLNGVSVVTALSVTGLRRRGWDVAVVAPRYPAEPINPFRASEAELDAVQCAAVPSWPMPLYHDLRASVGSGPVVADVMRRFRPDLVHCVTEFFIGRAAQRAALRRGLPVVSSYHTDFSRYTSEYGVPWLQRPVQAYLRRFHRRSRRVYTPGTGARDELQAIGVGNVQLWGRGVDVTLFAPDRRATALRQAYGGERAFLFLHVGRLAAEKGVERILHAFSAAKRMVPPAQELRLIIAGTGPREMAIRAMAPDGVTFLGNLDRVAMLPQLYASADAFVFASHTETLGLVILEAMASGLPVIAAPAGGVADHLRHGDNGLAYPPGDIAAMASAMAAVATSAPLRQRLSSGARRTALALSWEAEFDRLDASYRDLCRPAPDAISFDTIAGGVGAA